MEGQDSPGVQRTYASIIRPTKGYQHNLPRTALHCPTSDLGCGLLSLKAHATQLTVCHLHKIMSTPGYAHPHHFYHLQPLAHRVHHVTRFLPAHTQMPSPGPTRRRHNFQPYPALSLTNPIASTLRANFTRQDDILLTSIHDKSTHITNPHTYKQAYCDFTPRCTHKSLLPSLTASGKTTSPLGHTSFDAPPAPLSCSNQASPYLHSKGPATPTMSPSVS
jgi:hypothetical protein